MIRRLISLWKRMGRDTSGAAAIEYITLGAGVAVFVVLAWTFTGGQLSTLFGKVSSTISSQDASAVATSDSAGATETASNDNDSDSDFDDDS